MVTLETVTDGARAQFDVDHAERILRMRRSGWVLPKDSEYEYVNGNITRKDKGKGDKAKKA